MTMETAAIAQTLAQQMAQGRLPAIEGLRYSLMLAEALRRIHDAGDVHGALSPASIAITRTGLELLPALGPSGTITPYTAPEVVRGARPDSRSDIFSFGAIVYELLTGRAAFEAATPEELGALITSSTPMPSGSPAVDRLISSCLAKEPTARVQRVHKLTLELKLLAAAVRRAETAAARKPAEVLRADLEQIEARLTARMVRLEQGMTGVVERIADIASSLRSHSERQADVEHGLKTAGDLFQAFDRRAAAMEDTLRGNVQRTESLDERSAVVEQGLRTAGGRLAELDERITGVEQALRTAGESITRLEVAVESTRTAIAQTDDLVERVVEALDSLQTTVLD
jgi:hypothetical protein